MEKLTQFSAEAQRNIPHAITIRQIVDFDAGQTQSFGERRIAHGPSEQIIEDMLAYKEIGIQSLVCNVRSEVVKAYRRAVKLFASRVMPQLASKF